MRKNDIVKTDQGVFRILTVDEDQVLAIDCEKKTMPQFFPLSFFEKGEFLKEILDGTQTCVINEAHPS